MVKIKFGSLREIIAGLNELMDKELPIKAAYWTGKLGKMIHHEFIAFEDIRIKIVQKYAVKNNKNEFVIESDEDNNKQEYKLADTDAFNKEYKELLNTEIDIDFSPIPMSMFGDVKLSPIAMISLDKFIIIDE